MEARFTPTEATRLIPILASVYTDTLNLVYTCNGLSIETRPDLDSEALLRKTKGLSGKIDLDEDDLAALLQLADDIKPLLS